MKQIEKIILKETKGLHPYALNEILNFIQFIKEKKVKKKGLELITNDPVISSSILLKSFG